MFVHKDPVDNESDFQYIVRCVNRFNNLQNSNKSKLFFILYIIIVIIKMNY